VIRYRISEEIPLADIGIVTDTPSAEKARDITVYKQDVQNCGLDGGANMV
jgi:hypothetical protein